jgi:hypothetical protein
MFACWKETEKIIVDEEWRLNEDTTCEARLAGKRGAKGEG